MDLPTVLYILHIAQSNTRSCTVSLHNTAMLSFKQDMPYSVNVYLVMQYILPVCMYRSLKCKITQDTDKLKLPLKPFYSTRPAMDHKVLSRCRCHTTGNLITAKLSNGTSNCFIGRLRRERSGWGLLHRALLFETQAAPLAHKLTNYTYVCVIRIHTQTYV